MHPAPSSAATRGERRRRATRALSAVSSLPGRPTKRRPEPYSCRFGRGRRLEHQVAAGLGLRERHDLADVGLVGEERRPAVDAERDPAVRRRPVVERLEERPEALVHLLHGVALQREAALEEVLAPDSDGPAAQLPAVEDDVVLHRRARPAGSSGDGRFGSPDVVASSGSSSGTTPLNGLCVASQRPPSASHLYIGKRWTQRYERTFGSARPRRTPSSARRRPRTSAVTSPLSATTRMRSPSLAAVAATMRSATPSARNFATGE